MEHTEMTTKERTDLLNTIFAKYYEMILNHIKQRVSSNEDAEDLTSKVFVKAHRNLHSFNEETSAMSTWLHVIANNLVKDHYRTNHYGRNTTMTTDLSTDIGDHEFEFDFVCEAEADGAMKSEELSEKIMSAFRALKPKYRKVAVMYFMNERSYKEIADGLDIPMGSVKGMISRCRAMLQNTLTPQLAMS